MVAALDILARVFHTLASFPSPKEVLQVYATPEEQARMVYLIDKSKSILPEETAELNRMLAADRYAQLAKAKALAALKEIEAWVSLM